MGEHDMKTILGDHKNKRRYEFIYFNFVESTKKKLDDKSEMGWGKKNKSMK